VRLGPGDDGYLHGHRLSFDGVEQADGDLLGGEDRQLVPVVMVSALQGMNMIA
jgi:hypothetical protein